MGRKRRGRFRKIADAQEQLESIEEAQRRGHGKRNAPLVEQVEDGKRKGPLIGRIKKSKQRLNNAIKRIKKPDERTNEFK